MTTLPRLTTSQLVNPLRSVHFGFANDDAHGLPEICLVGEYLAQDDKPVKVVLTRFADQNSERLPIAFKLLSPMDPQCKKHLNQRPLCHSVGWDSYPSLNSKERVVISRDLHGINSPNCTMIFRNYVHNMKEMSPEYLSFILSTGLFAVSASHFASEEIPEDNRPTKAQLDKLLFAESLLKEVNEWTDDVSASVILGTYLALSETFSSPLLDATALSANILIHLAKEMMLRSEKKQAGLAFDQAVTHLTQIGTDPALDFIQRSIDFVFEPQDLRHGLRGETQLNSSL